MTRTAVIEFAIVGAIASTLSWATPLGAWGLNFAGLANWIPSLHFVMMPLMALFVGLGIGTAYLHLRGRRDR